MVPNEQWEIDSATSTDHPGACIHYQQTSHSAILVKDNSGAHAIYKGLALSAGGSGQLLYAADFHNNRIDVWNSTFGCCSRREAST